MTYLQHPLSAAFPAMCAAELQDLRDSIGNIGVQNPITLYEGMVLDGWHRYCVATEFRMACPEVQLDPLTDARDFVLAQNKARRHVTAAQMAMATTAVYAWRAPSGGRLAAQPRTECVVSDPAGKPGTECRVSLPPEEPGTQCRVSRTSAELAQIAGVGERTIRQAKAVHSHAAPEVVEAVKAGTLGLPKAAAIAQLPRAEQAAALAAPAQPRRAPAPAAPSEHDAQCQHIAALDDEIAALREQLVDAHEQLAAVTEIAQADEPLAAALEEAQHQRTLARGLQARVDSLMTEVADAKRQAAHWKRKAEAQPA